MVPFVRIDVAEEPTSEYIANHFKKMLHTSEVAKLYEVQQFILTQLQVLVSWREFSVEES